MTVRPRHSQDAQFAELVASAQADVWRLCAHLVDAQAADDLTQESFLRAWRALPRFRGESSQRTWLLSIAQRACMDELRQRDAVRRRDRALARVVATRPAGQPGPAGAVVLALLVDQLEPERRAAFVVTALLGLSYAEAAQVLDCPVGTIRSRVARARDELITMTDLPARAHRPARGRR